MVIRSYSTIGLTSEQKIAQIKTTGHNVFSNNGDGQWEGKWGLVGIIVVIVTIILLSILLNIIFRTAERKFASIGKIETKYAGMMFTFIYEVSLNNRAENGRIALIFE